MFTEKAKMRLYISPGILRAPYRLLLRYLDSNKCMERRSSQLLTQLMQLRKESLKKSGLPGFEP